MTAVIVQSEGYATRVGSIVRIARSLAALVSALAAEHRARQASKALYELNDHMLADIGLSRGDIARVRRI
jgi:uncharacterized protein YjiS (DUF1127 family)